MNMDRPAEERVPPFRSAEPDLPQRTHRLHPFLPGENSSGPHTGEGQQVMRKDTARHEQGNLQHPRPGPGGSTWDPGPSGRRCPLQHHWGPGMHVVAGKKKKKRKRKKRTPQIPSNLGSTETALRGFRKFLWNTCSARRCAYAGTFHRSPKVYIPEMRLSPSTLSCGGSPTRDPAAALQSYKNHLAA